MYGRSAAAKDKVELVDWYRTKHCIAKNLRRIGVQLFQPQL